MPYTLNINTDYLRTEDSAVDDREANAQPGKCNNFNTRRSDGKPIWIMEHHTVSNFERSLNIFTTGGVSAHYLINKDGTVYNLVEDQYRAYHAGIGSLKYGSKLHHSIPEEKLKGKNKEGELGKGQGDMNSWSIGIENVNSGFEHFTKEQTIANIYLHEKLVNTHGINPKNLLSHADWAPGRKIDPSPYYDWRALATASEQFDDIEHNFGVYPREPVKIDSNIIANFGDRNEDVSHIQSQLEELGYNIIEENNLGTFDTKTRDAILSFTIRYLNESIISNDEKLGWWMQVDNIDVKESVRNNLASWSDNHEVAMIDILGQFSEG